MRTQAAMIVPVLSVLIAGISVGEAARHRITERYDGIQFKLDWFDDERSLPYQAFYRTGGITSTYMFDSNGIVKEFKVDGETYAVKHKRNGKIKKVKHTSRRRSLAGDGEDGLDETDGRELTTAVDGRRRLYDCYDCELTWEMIRDYGVDSICDLVAFASSVTDEAADSIDLFCETFGEMFDAMSAYSVCSDMCDMCVAPLTIVLEWFSNFDLDLYVVEPIGGDKVYYAHMGGAYGYLEGDSGDGLIGGPEKYMGYGGLVPDDDENEYMVWVQRFGDSGDGEEISWTLTATDGNGDVLLEEDGEFGVGCDDETSSVFTVALNDYVDNGCADMDAISVVERSSSSKGTRKV